MRLLIAGLMAVVSAACGPGGSTAGGTAQRESAAGLTSMDRVAWVKQRKTDVDGRLGELAALRRAQDINSAHGRAVIYKVEADVAALVKERREIETELASLRPAGDVPPATHGMPQGAITSIRRRAKLHSFH